MKGSWGSINSFLPANVSWFRVTRFSLEAIEPPPLTRFRRGNPPNALFLFGDHSSGQHHIEHVVQPPPDVLFSVSVNPSSPQSLVPSIIGTGPPR